jgi:hypothetical protein
LGFAEEIPSGKSRFKKQALYLAQKHLAQKHLAQEHLAQDMHVVERIAAAMDVAGASIILGRQCRFATSDTLRLIIIIDRSHSASTG